MTSPPPRSVRFEASTESRLQGFAHRSTGLTLSGAVALLVEEGLRMDEHPGVVFRQGPSGRRAVTVGGPDVWEVIRAIQLTKLAEPELSGEQLLAVVCENTGVTRRYVDVAISYYADFPSEVDEFIEEAGRIEDEALRAFEQRRDLLGV